ncbi:hypothetical protein GCM10023165_07130 [Variovorax defluvii]|uniref:Uncharacterized protein n=1 Tax=Variovorax defluvii TaxID=913761 RepID=A0ABP8H050_9BURK
MPQTSEPNGDPFEEPEVIHSYERAPMLPHGELLDLSGLAELVGFIVPVTMTYEAWVECIGWTGTPPEPEFPGTCEIARLWQVLWLARAEALRHDGTQFSFSMPRALRYDDGNADDNLVRRVDLVLLTHAGDQGELVATIMLPWQD